MQEITSEFRERLFSALRVRIQDACPEFLSVTAVGSFLQSNDRSVASDVDLIVIVPQLNLDVFSRIRESVLALDLRALELPDWSLKVNDTFGPLKFNESNSLVIHLMIYDLEGHCRHVEDSPFTCLDWELGRTLSGYTLRELYPVGPVTLDDLILNRRGIENYLKDVEEGAVSYRRYVFDGQGKVSQVKSKMPCDERHTLEYAYHIMKFSILNLYKVLKQENIHLTYGEMTEFLSGFGGTAPEFDFAPDLRFFHELYLWKRENGRPPERPHERLLAFLNRMRSLTEFLNARLPVVSFLRHAETAFNDGSFLGQRRDPDILPPAEPLKTAFEYRSVWSGTLKRAVQTAELAAAPEMIRKDARLNEIDYGQAEGKTFPELKQLWPQVAEGWTRFRDVPFPAGENSSMVRKRLVSFIDEHLLDAEGNTLVVTHNVLMRLLVCQMFHLPVYQSYKFRIPNLSALHLKRFGRTLFPSISPLQRKQFRTQAALPPQRTPGSRCRYGLLWQPDSKTVGFVQRIKTRISGVEPDAGYCSHPVHSTFYVFQADERFEPQMVSLLRDAVLNLPSVRIEYGPPDCFRNDVCTGGDTLIWPIVPHDSLFILQTRLADLLERFRSVQPEAGKTPFSGEYLASFRKYGFPFIGKHWIPHITAASVRTQAGKEILAQCLSEKTRPEPEQLDSVSLFRIDGDEHKLVETFYFGDKQCE